MLDLCVAGDTLINEKASLIYRGKGKNGKVIERGIAFPVCISVNEYVCHYSPLPSEDKVYYKSCDNNNAVSLNVTVVLYAIIYTLFLLGLCLHYSIDANRSLVTVI